MNLNLSMQGSLGLWCVIESKKELTQSELAKKKWIICYYDFEHRKFT
ncbi:hypothetical protein ACT7DZ_16195 [Bacillus cereus]